MKFGIWAPQPHVTLEDEGMTKAVEQLQTADDDVCYSYQLILDTLRKAEQYGFTHSLIAERWLGPDLEAWILASSLATQTEKLELIVAVHPGIMTPQAVAKMSATLDRISGGRAAINIVNGWWEEEFNLFSNGAWLEDRDQRFLRMEEFIQVLRGVWSGKMEFDGSYYRMQTAEALPLKTATSRHPRIYAASQSPQGKQIIADTCNVWFLAYEAGIENAEKNVAVLQKEIEDMKSSEGDKQLEYAISAFVICEETMEEALEKAKTLEAHAEMHGDVAKVAAHSLGAGLVGTPEMIARRIQEYEEIGINHLMLRFNPIMEGLDRFAEQVMPLIENNTISI